MLSTDGCCGSIVVGWKKPPQNPFMRTVMRSAPPPPLPPPSAPPPPPPPESASSPPAPAAATSEGAWNAFVTPALHLPNFRYSAEGKARFTAKEWGVVESFVSWLSGVNSTDLSKACEWRYEPSAGAGDREVGIINFLRGLYIAPCLTYLLASSLDGARRGPLPALTIDVGGFAIEVVADRGAVSRVSLIHESGSREEVAQAAGAAVMRCPHARMMQHQKRARPPVEPLQLTIRPIGAQRLVVHIEVLAP